MFLTCSESIIHERLENKGVNVELEMVAGGVAIQHAWASFTPTQSNFVVANAEKMEVLSNYNAQAGVNYSDIGLL